MPNPEPIRSVAARSMSEIWHRQYATARGMILATGDRASRELDEASHREIVYAALDILEALFRDLHAEIDREIDACALMCDETAAQLEHGSNEREVVGVLAMAIRARKGLR